MNNRWKVIRDAIIDSGWADKLTIKEAGDLASCIDDELTRQEDMRDPAGARRRQQERDEE